MGIIQKGIPGPVPDTEGTLIGRSWKGSRYIRSRPTTTRRTGFSIRQMKQQAKFLLMIKIQQSMTPLQPVSFRNYAMEMSGFNNARRYNLLNAVTGTYPAYEVNYAIDLAGRATCPVRRTRPRPAHPLLVCFAGSCKYQLKSKNRKRYKKQ